MGGGIVPSRPEVASNSPYFSQPAPPTESPMGPAVERTDELHSIPRDRDVRARSGATQACGFGLQQVGVDGEGRHGPFGSRDHEELDPP